MKSLLAALAVSTALCLPAFAQSAPPLVLAMGGEPEGGFDPVMGWGHYGNPLFQATLLKLDANLNIVGDLATD
jgi:peptide/nickel transport system substrate-binding protein